MPSSIRTAVPGDAERIAHVYVDTWRDAYPGMLPDKVLIGLSEPRHTTFWERQIRSANDIVLVAEDSQSGVVGFGSAGRIRDRKLGRDGEVYTLYLLADWRNQGIGRALVVGLFRAMAERGYASAVIWVLADNPSRFFYETMGGQLMAEKVEELWGAPVRQFAYGWKSLERVVV
ncbi:MAG: GNAT family N-acetyltransferase [Proteobacteria bacterium]|nr:GNAT family N-acetyltransferase [Pseudomonadota bacterium]